TRSKRDWSSDVCSSDLAQDVLELSGRSGFSRFPVIDEDRDDVVGVVHVKQAVAVPRAKRPEVPVAALAEEAVRVPETIRLDQLRSEERRVGKEWGRR